MQFAASASCRYRDEPRQQIGIMQRTMSTATRIRYMRSMLVHLVCILHSQIKGRLGVSTCIILIEICMGNIAIQRETIEYVVGFASITIP